MDIDAPVVGISVSPSVGSVTVEAGANVSVTGVLAQVYTNGVLIWSKVLTDQTPSWQLIDDSQTPAWQLVSDTQTPNWDNVNT